MDSKVVNKKIRKIIRPYLKLTGFTRFTARSAWRYSPRKIDVVNFQSFNSYLADSLGCTTFSFTLNLGCYFLSIPPAHKSNIFREKEGDLMPEEYHCHFRRTLRKGLFQTEFLRRDIWYIDPDGKNLDPVIEDSLDVINIKALPWFEKYENLDRVLSDLQTGEESDRETFGFGANPSPIRHYFSGYIALVLSEFDLAKVHLQAAVDSGLYGSVETQIQAEIDQINLVG